MCYSEHTARLVAHLFQCNSGRLIHAQNRWGLHFDSKLCDVRRTKQNIDTRPFPRRSLAYREVGELANTCLDSNRVGKLSFNNNRL